MGEYFLLDNPNPNYKQYREGRRNRADVTGTISIHTAENYPDTTTPDLGAENVARWISRRDTPGSYHVLVDSDTIINMLPLNYEAWHDRFLNNWAIGISMATRADDWGRLSNDYRDKMIDNAARAAAGVINWVKSERGITVPVKWLTKSQSLARASGFIKHGISDPSRRHDPGAGFPSEYFLVRTSFYLGKPIAPVAPVAVKSYLPLRIDGGFGHRTITELQRALKRTGDYAGLIEADYNRTAVFGPVTALAYQRFLHRKRFYNEDLDGDFGRYSVWGEQNWLASHGLYKYSAIDGIRGPVTIRGLQQALNMSYVR